MEAKPEKMWLTVAETAERLGVSEPAVRRMIKAYKLPASRATSAKRSPWMINAPALERQIEIDEHKKRMQESGIVVGYGDFADNLEKRYPDTRVDLPDQPTLAEHARMTAARQELFNRVEREMYADPGVRQQLERLDDEDRFEKEARELASRVQRADRLRQRAQQILDEEDGGA
jgi:predicted DNA-binding transcriptional regulator AlpA